MDKTNWRTFWLALPLPSAGCIPKIKSFEQAGKQGSYTLFGEYFQRKHKCCVMVCVGALWSGLGLYGLCLFSVLGASFGLKANLFCAKFCGLYHRALPREVRTSNTPPKKLLAIGKSFMKPISGKRFGVQTDHLFYRPSFALIFF